MRKYFLGSLLFLLTVLSLTTLRSIVPELLTKQTISFVIAFGLFFVASKLPFSFYLQGAKWLYLATRIFSPF